MRNPSAIVQENGSVFDFVSQLGYFAFSSRFLNLNSDGCSGSSSHSLYLNRFEDYRCVKRPPRSGVLLSLSSRGSSSLRRFVNEFNSVIKFYCNKPPLGFASLGGVSDETNGIRDDGFGVSQDGALPLNKVEAENPKRVLILMSDTGGGHRASAEAIKAAFNEEFGNDYQVSFAGLMLRSQIFNKRI